ncbi:MAG: glucosamine-6-phosphate deaminase [Bacilli bacterium]|nr:glucosamine-6-phosphate deaminase [Bacilli bacterium]
MKLYVYPNDNLASLKAYEIVKKALLNKKNSLLGLATGSTPLKLYDLMIKDYKKGIISYKEVKTYNVDEYIGLEESHDQSYRQFMNCNLFNHIDINIKNIYFPKGVGNINKNIKEYDKTLESLGAADIQILGIGSNGHIAFNEPGTSFDLKTHVTNLSPSTIKDNSRFFLRRDQVPTSAITMGIKSILKAKKIILLAFGENKSNAIKKLLEEEVTEDFPASALKDHPDVIIICDSDAAKKIKYN